MELYVYDLNFNYCGMLEDSKCSSIIWTSSYYDCDEFEIRMPYFDGIFDLIKQDRFLRKNNSDRAMIIEKIYITCQYDNAEKVPVVKIAGRGAESLLDRRVCASTKTYSETVGNNARKIIIDNVLSTGDAARNIGIIELGSYPPTESGEQVTQGQNVGELTRSMLKEQKMGTYLKTDFTKKKFLYTIYEGVDRTKANMNKVEFSPDLDNFSQVEYYSDATTQYNFCMARSGVDGTGNIHIFSVASDGAGTGTARREIYADISSFDISGAGSTGALKLLEPVAEQELEKKQTVETITGTIIDGILYEYGIDYKVGDIVVLNDGYGHKLNKRLVQMIEYYQGGQKTMAPTFEDI